MTNGNASRQTVKYPYYPGLLKNQKKGGLLKDNDWIEIKLLKGGEFRLSSIKLVGNLSLIRH